MIKSHYKSKSFLIPFGLWLLLMVSVIVGLRIGESRYDSFVPAMIIWDAEHYFSIAADGYQVFPCDRNPEAICGNVGWFPFYPMTAKVVGWLGVDHRYALLGISWLSLLGGMLLIYRMAEKRLGERAALASLIALVIFPSSFYFLTAFPYALYLLLAVSILYLLERDRSWMMIPLTGFLTVTYPSGAVIGFPLLYYLLANYKKMTQRERINVASSIGAIGAAMFLYFAYYWIAFDNFLLYTSIHAQYYYSHEITFPLMTFYRVLTEMSGSSPVFIMVLFLLITLPFMYNRKLPISWQLFMIGVLLFTPAMGTCDCYYRHIVVAFPLYIMIGSAVESRWRRYLLIPVGLASLYLAWTVYFSMYKIGQLM
ncbi:MAG: hypothetical protein P1R58_02540 [bacterium]|nr:hypothetical protein [bacterium]